jgi:hypothetical protein
MKSISDSRPSVKTHDNNGKAPTAAPAPDINRQELLPLHKEPNLIEACRTDLATIGIVGEKDPALLCLLAYSSRKRQWPLSMIFKGPSGSGKDIVQRYPARLIHPEDVRDYMSITPEALYYQKDEDFFKHKVLLGGERSQVDDPVQRDRTRAVRQLISQGYLTKTTVRNLKTDDLRVNGPVSYSETTTQDSIFTEDATRCLQVNTDASADQTRRVNDDSADKHMPGADRSGAAEEQVIARHHDFQTELEDVPVSIPYALYLSSRMPTHKPEVRRYFKHILNLIDIIAFVHQFHRKPNEHGEIEAIVSDYELARTLIMASLKTAKIGEENHEWWERVAQQAC